jgi:2-octaprenyl-6-methoxyphenol hydroxylase
MDHDILIAGGGLAGMVAALAFARLGASVAVAEPDPAPRSDPRSTAFLAPSVALLGEIGVWPALRPAASPLRVMRLTALSPTGTLEPFRDFDSAESGLAEFGFNIANTVLREELGKAVRRSPAITSLPPAAFLRATPRHDQVLADLTDGSRIAARLVVAADGRGSAVVRALDLPVLSRSFGQSALAFEVSHSQPHDGISTEVHGPGGAFTLVPLADPHRSAVIWMERSDRAAALSALEDAAFLARASARAGGAAGALSAPGPRSVFPVVLRLARRLTGPRTAVIGEAAHVVPPIGAQGLNMSLGDISALAAALSAARASGQDIGTDSVLASWERRRLPDLALRSAGIAALNSLAMLEGAGLRRLRSAALTALHGSPPLRRGLIRLGLGGTASPLALAGRDR